MIWLAGIGGFWNSQYVFPSTGCWLLWLLLISLWHICGIGTGAHKKCLLLWLTVPFLCPALFSTQNFNCLISKKSFSTKFSTSDESYLQKAILVVLCLGPRENVSIVFIWAN